MEKGISGFETIIIVILTIILILVGFVISGWLNPGLRVEDTMNRTEELKEGIMASGKTCDGEVSGFQHDMFRADGTYGGAWIIPGFVSNEVGLTCWVPGTGEGYCIFDSFFRGQELTQGGKSSLRRGWFSFSLIDPYSSREFEYTCVWDYDTYTEGGLDKISFKKDMRDDYDNFRQVGMVEAGENATVKSEFALLNWDPGGFCDPPSVFNVRSECGPPDKGIFCDAGVVREDFWNWTLIAGGYYCCPPSGQVKDTLGNPVGTTEGGILEEDWRWDRILEMCCVNESCSNYYDCEEIGGKWAFGECWFEGTGNCNNVCNNEPDTPMVCKPPDYWNRIPQTCEIHKIMGLDCRVSCTESLEEKAPYGTAGNECVDQNNLTMSAGWCEEPPAGFIRICACELP
ncbi:MAG: hypothetical protein JSV92_01045 [archaeon]|nr:MAG: hypothetical protein JSV92_01045 [archaeon]